MIDVGTAVTTAWVFSVTMIGHPDLKLGSLPAPVAALLLTGCSFALMVHLKTVVESLVYSITQKQYVTLALCIGVGLLIMATVAAAIIMSGVLWAGLIIAG